MQNKVMKEKEAIVKNDEKFRWFVVEKLWSMETRVSKLEIKSGVWGMLGGVATIAIMIGAGYIKIKQ